MSISRSILGMNARNFLYISKYNKPAAKRRADDKLATKKLLIHDNIPTAGLLHIFSTRKSIRNYSWALPAEGFVIKPARGYGGEGIMVFKKWGYESGTTISDKEYKLKQLQSHILDIFDGIYSLQSLPDKAYIEERIIPAPFFRKLTPIGLPDIRIIVLHKIPVMAMLRIPTEESHGKANLHQGAIGAGIGMRTGITKHAIYKNKSIRFMPGTKIKTNGIKIPNWDEILFIASRAQDLSGLGYAGIDIVFDKIRGPVVLEINSRPGLNIQNANLASLRARLERIENLNVKTAERGVEIARSVFAEEFSDKVRTEIKVLSVYEPIIIISNGKSKEYKAKLDTGAYRTSLDESVVQELNLPLVSKKFVAVSASGKQTRPAVKVEFQLGGKKVSTIATVAARSHLKFPIIVGRRDLRGFHINPSLPAGKAQFEQDGEPEEEHWDE
ncbi:MAG: hypothetical protein A3C27_01810 [Candidatus Levybacteria bacterium RIFCSPHIGHO2_02_FULL_39_36]|nr:MAG: hypothetical protein UT20_C0007G0031 [Candidatus Levybacteria bacterium GW2011_GWA1_39_11]KKR24750.1 MAG: hypothetical protein UT56_C0009G0015 [Candidatus Levybacteria bacterium GW2011_GWB1_39_7]KKR26665.1 MAG: alpha-L-glutamate ligase-related protein [Microgenomates group bacterium GW2011_GWC1_39_7]OGH15242.1 MAG: hypothetical protein A2689_00990 [Candidatus Levybacteria bacterium RIFCSPHIGHO2_01_FULL_38_96]OGH25752.1 MAG: hypothetical protein A3E68_01725 [Candidatus Levybacteria bacte